VTPLGPPLAAAALAVAAQVAPAPDVDKGVAAALGAFAFGCLERLPYAASAKDYQDKSQALGAGLAAQFAPLNGAVSLDGGAPGACRVIYRGSAADRLFAQLTGPQAGGAGCSTQTAADRVVVSCPAGENPAYEQVTERRPGEVSARIVYRGPALKGAPRSGSPSAGPGD
jgi:hypothetical protein